MAVTGELKTPLTLEQLATLFRQRVDDLPGDIVDTSQPWQNNDDGLLWKNQEICQYADEAQNEVVIRTGGILDQHTTIAINHITVTAGTQAYTYDNRILKIERMKFVEDATNNEYVVIKKTPIWMDEHHREWDLEGNATGQGIVEFFVEFTEEKQIRLWRVPGVAGVLHLTTYRLPVTPLSWTLRHKLLEVRAEYQYDMLDWMMFRAYLKRDAETENPELAGIHKSLFDERIGERPSADLQTIRRREHKLGRRVTTHFF
jgi:hypothetical protein